MERINEFRFIEFNTDCAPSIDEILNAVRNKENIRKMTVGLGINVHADADTFIATAERELVFGLKNKTGYVYFLDEGFNFLGGSLFEFKKDEMPSGWHYLKLVLCGFF